MTLRREHGHLVPVLLSGQHGVVNEEHSDYIVTLSRTPGGPSKKFREKTSATCLALRLNSICQSFLTDPEQTVEVA